MIKTYADVLAHNARIAAGKAGAPARDIPADEGPESKLQGAIRRYCADQMWPCLCGSMATATHRTPGELDLTIPLPKGRVVFIECKKKGGKPTAEQQTMILWLRSLGHEAYIIDSFQLFLNIVNPTKL